MNISKSFDISASALTAQRLRMDVISSNIANSETTRARIENGEAVPYKRKMVVLESNQPSFKQMIDNEMQGGNVAQGVKVAAIEEDTAPLKPVYNPTHPDANAEGYVYMPNVDTTKEMVDLIGASRSYEANVTALNASKAMVMKALEIGR
ncbi:flagellar basal body rod protein FlgC [Paenibacillus urinalis]|uniref:Flagellar basal-body rod protein FlgC n=1 Tax=Paenibacillus urinalis TaxID=521520 RepID=A0AAX3N512_9BACL|nr:MULTISPECIES: flagellar basal body rod protein FlgC [Paenibacillus]WDH84481.1 flagellar basal body rod protein FlgC [Paenibacillus urinalis]WDH95947.1 flagellar basal body rod protein FlgC [Paenibacillus urinalis]WDI04164.1 flagellar basal body rod protein FlgC [Paenibacillus urinalis]GAK38514.1 flagellar basal-body rod protein FlgC [Paenibacillus sp. TCA20]